MPHNVSLCEFSVYAFYFFSWSLSFHSLFVLTASSFLLIILSFNNSYTYPHIFILLFFSHLSQYLFLLTNLVSIFIAFLSP